MQAIRSALVLTVSAGALFAVLGASPAAATPVFTVNPNAITGITGYTPQQISDLTVTSDSTIVQTTPNSQTETGFAYASGFTNNGTPVTAAGLGPVSGNFANAYELYFQFSAVVDGLTGFTAGQNGTIAPGGFNFSLSADPQDSDTFAPGSTAPTNPTITGKSNDLVLAVGSSLTGSAGFQTKTGAPTIDTVSSFIICDGTVNQGVIDGATVAAAGCGTYDARNYFVAPSPFYDISFVSATAGSISDLTVADNGLSATLNNVSATVNFAVPEPLTLSLFGAGLLGMGALRRRKSKAINA